jgi:WD40 repeat protein
MKAMNILGAVLLLALGAASSVTAQPAGQNRSLTIPIWFAAPAAASSAAPASEPALLASAATPASPPALECTVSCGAAIPLSGIAFSPDGKTLAVGGYKEILVWDLVEGKLAKRIGAGQIGSMVQAVVFSKDGKTLAAAEGTPCAAGAVRIFDPQSGQLAASFQEPKGVVFCLAVSPDGKFLAGGCGDALVYVWSLEEKKLVTTLKRHSLAVVSVAFGGDAKSAFLVTASLDKTVQVWEAGTWKPDRVTTTLEAPVQRCFLQQVARNAGESHRLAFILGGHDSRSLQVRLDDKAPGWARSRDVKLDIDGGTPLDCLWLKDKDPSKWFLSYAYVACSDATVKVFAFDQKLRQIATLRGHSGWVYAVAANAEAARLASAGSDGSVKLWNTADRSPLATLVQLAPGKDDWLIVSGQGYYATSTPAAVQWSAAGAKASPEKLSGLQNPEMVRQTLAGKQVPPPVLQ